jgi:hypothetical protein
MAKVRGEYNLLWLQISDFQPAPVGVCGLVTSRNGHVTSPRSSHIAEIEFSETTGSQSVLDERTA